jgi:exosome complex RNA-binding protein Rrp42 (RNase PH superfamily)
MEVTLSFNVLADDGSLPTALMTAAWDLLTQLSNAYGRDPTATLPRKDLLKVPVWLTSMYMISVTGQLVADPTYEEMHISNNLLTITSMPDGKQLVDKTLSVRTYAGGTSTV